MELWTVLLQLLPVLAFLYWYISRKHNYWSDRGVIGPKPFFLFGDLPSRITRTIEIDDDWRNRYGRIYGSYTGLEPVLSISDAEMIKEVMVKDFADYVNRRKQNVFHEILNENLFALEDEKWKSTRSIVTPAFTSGKLRGMQVLMNQCVDKLIRHLDRVINNSNTPQTFKTKEVITKFTIDVIATTSFAVETNDESSEELSPFVKHALNLFNLNKWLLVPIVMFPLKLNNLLNIRMGTEYNSTMFFINLCKQVIKQRKSNPKFLRNDLVQLLLDAKVDLKEVKKTDYETLSATMDDASTEHKIAENKPSSSIRSLTEMETASQLFLFLVAGFETTATTLSFGLHELAVNQDCQERLLEEVLTATAGIEDDTSEEYFEIVNNKIPYLEAVTKEILRKYPPVSRLERRAARDGLKVGGVELYKDQRVEVPTYAVHMDPEYYPEPKVFNPERFMPENKANLVPYTYLPFGTGPRNCVGMRFAYQEVKICLARLITRFHFVRAPTTKEPVEMRKGAFLMTPVSLDLAVERR